MGSLGARLATAVALVLTLGLAGCSGSGDDDEPGTTPASEQAREPTRVERFYPDTPDERIVFGSAEYVDPCRLLPIDKVRSVFGFRQNSSVIQEAVTHSLTGAADLDTVCWYPGAKYQLKVDYESSTSSATYDLRWRARNLGSGIWFYADTRRGAFDDVIDDLGQDTSGTTVYYRIRFDQGIVQLQLEVPAGRPVDLYHRPARTALAAIRASLKDPGALDQGLLGPVLRGRPVARGTTIIDACALLSPAVVTGLTGNDDHNLKVEHTTAPWRHEVGTHPTPKKKWASPYTECRWGTGGDAEESPNEYDVDLMVRSHPDDAEAHRSYTALIGRNAVRPGSLKKPTIADLDEGGWSSSTTVLARTTLYLRVGRYTAELTIGVGDRAVFRQPAEMDDAAAAIVDRLRDLDRAP